MSGSAGFTMTLQPLAKPANGLLAADLRQTRNPVMPSTFPSLLGLRPTSRHMEHVAEVAAQLRAAGRTPTTTNVLRHCLQIAATISQPATLVASTPLAPEPAEPVPAIVGTALIQAYTDGACSGNPGPGGWAVVAVRDGMILAERSGGCPQTTNNRMELEAIRGAIRAIPDAAPLEIATDSAVAIGWLSKGFARKVPEVAAMCADIDRLIAARSGPVTFVKMKGYASHVFNERADRLAVAARDAARPAVA